ncbi:unnamed protein product [Brachionus calyciflorus]|uniref:Innexin n=1 Tax=Brachionus calyciflorus TaxID=104777 RepID=A0A814EJN9_9BILA|nr:unnamed protein product [Brachionus calyciflorus]
MEFVNTLRSLGVSRKHSQHNDDLFVDRLNHRYTVAIIVVFALVVTWGQYGGSPINCWVPGHFTGNYANYAEKICWVSSTYNVPISEELPKNESERKVKMLKYYQWTPFILLFQALLFYLPRMIWRSLNDKSGLDIQTLVDTVYKFNTDASKYADKQKLLNYMTNLFDNYVRAVKQPNDSDSVAVRLINREDTKLTKRKIPQNEDEDSKHETDSSDFVINEFEMEDNDDNLKSKSNSFLSSARRFSKILCITKGKRYGNYLLALFVFVKIFYTLNSFIQLFILNHFLGNDFLFLGLEVMNKVWNGEDWTQLERFPRVTMCDFKIREVGIVHRYTVQCVLSINLFNEKIFIFLWFWLCVVSIFNIFDLISWSYTLIINTHESYSYVKRRLNVLNSPIVNARKSDLNFDEKLYKSFVNNYLKEDGILALRLLSRNSQDLIVSELINSLFNLYKAEMRMNRRINDQKGNISS